MGRVSPRAVGADGVSLPLKGDRHRSDYYQGRAACTVEQGQVDRADATAEAQGDLGHADPPAARRENAGSCDVQSGDRQQAEGMRSDETAGARRLPWLPLAATCRERPHLGNRSPTINRLHRCSLHETAGQERTFMGWQAMPASG